MEIGEFCENLSSTKSQLLRIDPDVAGIIPFCGLKLSCIYIYFKIFENRLSVSKIFFSDSPSRRKKENQCEIGGE